MSPRNGTECSIMAPVFTIAYELSAPSRHMHSFLSMSCQEKGEERKWTRRHSRDRLWWRKVSMDTENSNRNIRFVHPEKTVSEKSGGPQNGGGQVIKPKQARHENHQWSKMTASTAKLCVQGYTSRCLPDITIYKHLISCVFSIPVFPRL